MLLLQNDIYTRIIKNNKIYYEVKYVYIPSYILNDIYTCIK